MERKEREIKKSGKKTKPQIQLKKGLARGLSQN